MNIELKTIKNESAACEIKQIDSMRKKYGIY